MKIVGTAQDVQSCRMGFGETFGYDFFAISLNPSGSIGGSAPAGLGGHWRTAAMWVLGVHVVSAHVLEPNRFHGLVDRRDSADVRRR